MHMGRKPYSERSKELKNIRTMETLVPSNLLHVDDDDNQFNPEPEINHTASSSSDSRTNYDAIAAAAACSLELSTTAAGCRRRCLICCAKFMSLLLEVAILCSEGMLSLLRKFHGVSTSFTSAV